MGVWLGGFVREEGRGVSGKCVGYMRLRLGICLWCLVFGVLWVER